LLVTRRSGIFESFVKPLGLIMLNFWCAPQGRDGDGLSRRQFLKAGTLGIAGLTLADVLQARADNHASRSKAVIMICLPGGPSHLDTYDMKPAAAEECRGEFRPIATNVPGISMCELMPRQTRIADKLAIVRNLVFSQPDHQLHEVYTGFPTAAHRPAFGSCVSRVQGPATGGLPRYMSLSLSEHPRTVAIAETPTYAGRAHAPFEPTTAGLSNLRLPVNLRPADFADRRALRQTFDTLRRDVDGRGLVAAQDAFTAQAFELITSPQVQSAFDLSQEPAYLRDRYGPDVRFKFDYQFGHTWYGTQFLLARRLVEAGVPIVTIGMGGWDHHGNVSGVRGTIFERSREQLPFYDRSIAALVSDLYERGLDRDVAVVVWGEFGRTPLVNRNGGRDHWPAAGFALCAGGGWRTGQLIGETTARGEQPRGRRYTPQNVLASLYQHLEIDPATTLPDFTGRPRSLLDDLTPIAELG
jgi:hypothetical protein